MKSPITIKSVKKFLSSCEFRPNDPGPLKIIVETNNPDYFEQRAIEMIMEARQIFGRTDMSEYLDKMRKAIILLTLATLLRNKDE